MCLRNQRRPVGESAASTGQLGDDAEEFAVRQAVPQVSGDDLDAQRLSPGGQHRGGLRVHVDIDGQPVGVALHCPMHQRHRLGSRGALVEHRRVGHLETGQVGHHRLKVQQRLQPALTDFRLVGRVGRVPGRVLQDVAEQHRRCVGVGIALADHRHRDRVRVGQRPQLGQRLGFRGRGRQLIQAGRGAGLAQCVEDLGRQRATREFIQGVEADDLEHRRDGIAVRADVPIGEERVGVVGHWRTPDRGKGTQVLPLCRLPEPGA
jgi:hypothetical protein